MAHHSAEAGEISRRLAEMKHELGPTGKFPMGRISEEDEGEIKIGVTIQKSTVILGFGKQISWVGFTHSQARELAASLIEHANKAQGLSN